MTLTLERLLYNIIGNEEVMVVNEDDGTIATGTELAIRTSKPKWCNYLVTNMFYNHDAHMIQVVVSSENNIL